MRHNALAREILVDQAVVDAVGCVREDFQGRYTIDDGVGEPRWHFGGSEESVVCCELGGDGLEAAVGEGDPAVCGDLCVVVRQCERRKRCFVL